MKNLKSHTLVKEIEYSDILVEKRPLLDAEGHPVEGLCNHWIFLNNPRQYNSYTTAAIKEIILALREASCDRSAVAVIFTAVGDKAFCTGGNTKEYAEYYAGNPQEYKQYMRLFNDMVTHILICDKPVINRVNGMRIAGGQEIGMACDFSVASDLARFGQAGPKHGSAPDGGSTDFLHLFVGMSPAMESLTLCQHWSAHQAVRLGLINKIVPVLKDQNNNFISNPMVSSREYDDWGNPAYGAFKSGVERAEAKKIVAECEVDLSLLDREVNRLACSLAMTMPDCLSKTIESIRKKKLEHWQQNSETNRSWLALNMMTEAKLGFRAFNEGPKDKRQVDFFKLRQELAKGRPWTEEMVEELIPQP
ncbi:MAG TPA: 6-oxocyclohex-1-ene-1-carbonyl-CoA hydratase [Bacteroidetes bacterium]|nr:6-oxocyclohex-1-ene-1-carbonyl-CoA hydratase [Bacteroidota bacterium]